MAKFLEKLTPQLCDFINAQKLFFTATAPSQNGRVNLSPKGMDTLQVVDLQTVSYLDLTGSGNETSAHIRDNGRMTMMFCSFSGDPLILRLYGAGEIITPSDPNWQSAYGRFHSLPGARQIIVLHIESVQSSCGFAIPFYEYQGERDTLLKWAENKGEQGIHNYWQEKNQTSIDGLPAVPLTSKAEEA